MLSRSAVSDFMTPGTVACQAPLSTGVPRQEQWTGLPFPSLGDLPDPGIELTSLRAPELACRFLIPAPPGKPLIGRVPAPIT